MAEHTGKSPWEISVEDGLALSYTALFHKITNKSTQKLSMTFVIQSIQHSSLGQFPVLPDIRLSASVFTIYNNIHPRNVGSMKVGTCRSSSLFYT